MTTSTRTLIAALALALPGALAAQYPTSPPPSAPLKPAAFPPFQEAVLSNGVHLVVVENHKAPVVSISLSMPAGEIYDPAGKDGVGDMAATLLTKGAGPRGAEQIAEAIESVGGSIASGANRDFATVRADVLSANAALGFELVGDAVARPTFPERELELLRTQTLSALQLEQSDPAAIASRAFSVAVYGSGPYARHESPASVRSITRTDLLEFQKAHLRPAGALLVVAGDIGLAKAKELAARALSGWTGAPTGTVAMRAPAPHTASQIILVHRPASVQSNVYVGGATFRPTDPQAFALRVASRLLGGGPQSRLFMIVREQKSYAYDAHSEVARPKDVGTFRAVTQVRTDVTDSALTEVLAQLKRLQTEPVPAAELDAAKSSLVGAFPLSIETAEGVAGAVTDQKLLGLPADYLRTYRTKLNGVTAPEIEAVAKRVMGPSVIVIVGDATKIYDKLQKIAPVTLMAVDGTPMSPSDLVVKAAALSIDPSKLRLGVDSFEVVLTQGGQTRNIGYQRSELAKVGENYVATEVAAIPLAGIQQTTVVTFAPSMALKEIKETGTMQGQQIASLLTFANGRVKGTATAPQPGGAKTTNVDTTATAGLMEESQITSVLPVLDLKPGFQTTVSTIDSNTGAIEPTTIKVTGTETVVVPAGSFESYRVELGSKQTVVVMVTVAAPHRIVKIMPGGAPIEIRLVK